MIISSGKIEATNDMVQMRRKVKAFTCISMCDEKDIMFKVNFDFEKKKTIYAKAKLLPQYFSFDQSYITGHY